MSEVDAPNVIQSQQGFKVKGPLVLETVAGLAGALPDNVDRIVIDLMAITEADSAALALFLEWQRQAKERKITLEIIHWPDNLKSLLDLYNLDEIMPT